MTVIQRRRKKRKLMRQLLRSILQSGQSLHTFHNSHITVWPRHHSRRRLWRQLLKNHLQSSVLSEHRQLRVFVRLKRWQKIYRQALLLEQREKERVCMELVCLLISSLTRSGLCGTLVEFWNDEILSMVV